MAEFDDRGELLELYKLAHAEYRAEVALGWERQKFFLSFGPLLATAAAALGSYAPTAARLGLLTAAALSVSGILVLKRSHGRYRATRSHMQALEKKLGLQGLETTGGMRVAKAKPRLESFKIVTVLMTVLGGLAVCEVGLALMFF